MKEPIKLYLAILNRGWVKSEHIGTVFMASRTPGVTLVMEPPSVSFATPIASNRCRITKRFLETDCDFLLMLDDDVIPYHNPAEMVFFDKDIVGSPTRRGRQGMLEWVAYAKHPKLDHNYASIDLNKVNPEADLLKVDAIGTGCILIKRKVLETLKRPFEDVFDEDGIRKFGQDLNFCKKAIEAGFEVFITPNRVCEHFKEIGLVNLDHYFVSRADDEVLKKYGIPWGDFAIIEKDWDFIREAIEQEGVETVLEFGTGLSTLLISEMASVDTFETDVTYMDKIIEKLPEEGRDVRFYTWDGIVPPEPSQLRKKYDLAFVDGPVGKDSGGIGREVSIRLAVEHSDRIIIHDAGRPHEAMLQEKYLKDKFQLVTRNGWHQARCNYWRKKDATS